MTAPLRPGESVTVNVPLGERAYDIVIGRGLLSSLGRRLAALRPKVRAAIVTDAAVSKLYLDMAEATLSEAGISSVRIIVPEGEKSKSFRVFERVCETLIAERHIDGDGFSGAKRRGHDTCSFAALPRFCNWLVTADTISPMMISCGTSRDSTVTSASA